MKTLLKLLCATFSLFPFLLFSQIDEWTPAAPLTDSLSDNKNAIVEELQFYSGWDHYVIWEKSTDANSTSIYTRRYYFDDEPIALVEDNHHNTGPCVLKLVNMWDDPPADTTFYLVYLSDINGNYDIYYQKYSTSGFSGPYPLTQTSGDEKHLRSNGVNGLTWEYEGAIKSILLEQVSSSSYIFSEIITVDSGDCKNPVTESIADFGFMPSYIAFEKVIDGLSRVMISQFDWINNGWAVPEVVYDTGNNINLKFAESSFDMTATTLSWDNVDDAGRYKLMNYDPGYKDFLELDYVQLTDFMPTAFNIFVGVSDIWFFALQSFTINENGQGDIYGGYQYYWFPDGYTNLSASSANDVNPHLWNGIYYYDKQDVIDIWESYRNGHWQLWASRTQVPLSGNIKENNRNMLGTLEVFPNPFSNQFTLTINSSVTGHCSIILLDLKGKQVSHLLDAELFKGSQSWFVDLSKELGNDLPAGVYFVKLQSGGKEIVSRIIKL